MLDAMAAYQVNIEASLSFCHIFFLLISNLHNLCRVINKLMCSMNHLICRQCGQIYWERRWPWTWDRLSIYRASIKVSLQRVIEPSASVGRYRFQGGRWRCHGKVAHCQRAYFHRNQCKRNAILPWRHFTSMEGTMPTILIGSWCVNRWFWRCWISGIQQNDAILDH